MGNPLSSDERKISDAADTIDSKLKDFTFAQATGKEVIKIGLVDSKTNISLKIVK